MDSLFHSHIKQAIVEWKHHGLPRKKKYKVTPSAAKVLAIIFQDLLGMLLVDILNLDVRLMPAGTAPH